ncbi:MAG TPA: AsmA family protein [Granulicella sp.]
MGQAEKAGMEETVVEQGSEDVAGWWQRRRRLLIGAAVVLVPLVAIAFVVPLLNINRFQRRVIASLSESLGRPIHLDTISLTVFPLPGLDIENLTVAEDPGFGAEPFVHSNSVHATIRLSSLWRRRIEFSSINFTEPSINLVRTSSGQWNIESILLRASRLNAAPTGQLRPSDAPRFPYIEATGARLNLKTGEVKQPLSLTDADLALWLSSPQQWQLRLKGSPMRTDRDLPDSDTGTFQLEGSLGHSTSSTSLESMPIDLRAEWRNVPMGDATRVLIGSDAGLRGTLSLGAIAKGTIGHSSLQTTLHLTDLRRADFIPPQTLTFDAECLATQEHIFHALTDVRCSMPPALTSSAKQTFALTGSVPDVRQLETASVDIGTPGIPAVRLLDWARVASSRLSPGMSAAGSLVGGISYDPKARWAGQLTLNNSSLTVPEIDAAPLFKGTLAMRLVSFSGADPHPQLVLPPTPLTLGSKDFATVDARFDPTGYVIHLTGTAAPEKLHALGANLPLLDGGMTALLPPSDSPAPLRFDLQGTHVWGHGTAWSQSAVPPPHHHKR